MDFSDFFALLTEELSRRLPAGADVRMLSSSDGRRFAEIFSPADCLFPAVPLDAFLRDCEGGRPPADIAEDILRLYGAGTMHPVYLPADFENKKAFCAGLRLFPVPGRADRRLARGLPFHSYCGLTFVYTVRAGGAYDCLGDAFVTEELLRHFRIRENELLPTALKNMINSDPVLILPLRDYLDRLFSDVSGGYDPPGRPAQRNRLYVLTNPSCMYGACSILYPGITKTLLRRFGPYYLLPSSVHELLILPQKDAGSVPELQGLIRRSNDAMPDPLLVLSDVLLACDGPDGLHICP